MAGTDDGSLAQLKLILEELKSLGLQAKQNRVKTILDKEATIVLQEISAHERRNTESKPTIPTIKILNFSFDESEKFVKLYVFQDMKGVQSLPAQSIVAEFQNRSFSVLVKELSGKNLQVIAQQLIHDIEPSESYAKARDDQLVIMLRKKKSETWGVLTESEKRVQSAKEERERRMYGEGPGRMPLNMMGGGKHGRKGDTGDEEQEDPSAQLMNMMKRMYDEGDDTMKRTIAESWTKSRDKSAAAGGNPF